MELLWICLSISCMTKSHKWWPSRYTQPKVSWMLRMRLLPRKSWNLNDWKLVTYTIQSKVLIQKRPRREKKEIETAGRQDRPQDDIPTTLPWMLHLTKCWWKSRMTRPWNGQIRWKKFLENGTKASVVVSTEITGMTQTSVMTWKTYLWVVQNVQLTGRPPRTSRVDEPAITFTLTIAKYTTRRVLVDNGSSADILYYPAFQQIRVSKELLRLVKVPLIGFGGMKVLPVGTISLLVIVGSYPRQINKEVNFLVMDCSS